MAIGNPADSNPDLWIGLDSSGSTAPAFYGEKALGVQATTSGSF